MATLMNRQSFGELMIPGLLDVIALKYKEYPIIYPKYTKVQQTNKQYEEIISIEGMPISQEKNEGAPVNYDAITQGYKTKFKPKSYAQAGRITRECYDDDLYGVFSKKLGEFLARSMRIRQEMLVADVLNYGFIAGYEASGQTGGDGKALFATDHPFKSGGTYANKRSASAALSHTALEDLITLLRRQKDAHNVPIMLQPKLLIVPPELEWTAKTIVQSDQKSGTSDNDKNVIKELGLQVLVNPYLTSSTAWFLQADEHGLVYFNRRNPVVQWSDDFDTGDLKIKVEMRASAGYESPIGMYGSEGV